ncbi:hypothetical protein MP477_10550 [Chryseobacterium sp. WG23]|uniref:hypothetical protein n=1 Tax=Chryseobacterium sp. WG23 TaxID=2926910 RepID=UPI00211E7656|nr:hypothetical protein [Chryseobacterium sp. WG23]MCQ9635395.1 hypothetical protein [Chryseobacterium sp. WG23]
MMGDMWMVSAFVIDHPSNQRFDTPPEEGNDGGLSFTDMGKAPALLTSNFSFNPYKNKNRSLLNGLYDYQILIPDSKN